MITALHSALTEKDKQFLLAVKHGDADWNSFVLPDVQHLPAIQWKLHNLAQMQVDKRKQSLEALRAALYVDRLLFRAKVRQDQHLHYRAAHS